MKRTWVSILLFGICALLTAADEHSNTINEATARKLASTHYNELFKDKFIFNQVDSKYHQFPHLEPDSFRTAAIKDGCWQLALDPPAGWFVYAKVSLDGKWIQLMSTGYASE